MKRIQNFALSAVCLVGMGCDSPNSTPMTNKVAPVPINTPTTKENMIDVPIPSSVDALPGNSGNRLVTTITDKDGKKIVFTQVEVKYRPPAPPYPPEAKALGIQGFVKVMVIVGPDGTPRQANAEEGPKELRKSSEIYALTWRFYPALLNGVPQYARFIINIPYKLLNEGGNAP